MGAGSPIRVTVFSGESEFRERLLTARVPLFPAQNVEMTARVAHVGEGDRPDLVLTTPRGGTGEPEIHIVSGESDFGEFLLQIRLALGDEDPDSYRFVTGSRDGRPVLYAVSSGEAGATTALLPLLYLASP
jgi:hypothetical protein